MLFYFLFRMSTGVYGIVGVAVRWFKGLILSIWIYESKSAQRCANSTNLLVLLWATSLAEHLYNWTTNITKIRNEREWLTEECVWKDYRHMIEWIVWKISLALIANDSTSVGFNHVTNIFEESVHLSMKWNKCENRSEKTIQHQR